MWFVSSPESITVSGTPGPGGARPPARGDQALAAGVRAHPGHRVAVPAELSDLGIRGKARSGCCLRRAWRSYEEQRQDDPEAAHRRNHSEAMAVVHIGLGANLGDREATIRAALERLDAEEGIE